MKWANAMAAGTLVAVSGGVNAQQSKLSVTRVASGLINPLYVTAPPGDTTRIFIVEQQGSGGTPSRGDIKILNLGTGVVNATPFLSVNGLASNTEQGLLGLAFDPNYASNGFFFVYYTDSSNTIRLVRYHVSGNPDIADAASATPVLSQSHPADNHNGGWIAFGPDHYLYIGIGDGGGSGDPNGNAQNLTVWLGKLLRIDVSSLPYAVPATNPFFGSINQRPEIWAYGLRNPWRNSFDRLTGELWIGDVGQGQWEEIDRQPAGISGPGSAVNYGWRCYEANNPFDTSGCPSSTTMTFPVYSYGHSLGRCSLTGGYVYRGASIATLRGTYLFADYCGNQIYSFRYSNGSVYAFRERTAELNAQGLPIQNITSFGEDAAGELYIVCQGGDIFRITNACWVNCDNSTSTPMLNIVDFQCFLNSFAAGGSFANCDETTTAPILNILDFQCFLNAYASGCS